MSELGDPSSDKKCLLISDTTFSWPHLYFKSRALEMCRTTSDSKIPQARDSSTPCSSYMPIFIEQCNPCSAIHTLSISTESASRSAASGIGLRFVLDIRSPNHSQASPPALEAVHPVGGLIPRASQFLGDTSFLLLSRLSTPPRSLMAFCSALRRPCISPFL